MRHLLIALAAIVSLHLISPVSADPVLGVDASGRHLYNKATGEPFFWLGDTAWSLFGRNQNEIKLYFQERSAQGFNVISIGNLFPNYSTCDNAGNYPFTDSNGAPVPCPGFERKAGAEPQISHITPIGQVIPASPADSTSYSWTDGRWVPQVSNTNTLISFAGNNNGYMFSLPADATTRTLRLYVGGVNSRSRITAAVTDGSTAPYTATIDTGPNDLARNEVVTINYRAGANGQALIVRHIILDDYGQNGSINIQAATLQEDNSGAAPGGSMAPAPATVNLTSEGTLDWAHWGFTGSPAAGSPNINRPNEAFFGYLDWIIDTAADYGLYVSIRGLGQQLDNAVTCAFPSNDPETSNYSPMHLTPGQARSFTAWLGNRWKDKPNLIFSGGQDKNAVRSELSPSPCANAPDQRPYWRAQAEGWLQGVTGEVAAYNQDHPAWDRIIMTWHPAGGNQNNNSSAWFPDDRWLTLNQNQSWSFRDHYASIASDWARIPARPTFFGESVYEGANRGNINATVPRNLRTAAWTSVLAGAFGFTYGAEGVYFFNGLGDNTWVDLVRNNEAGKQMGFLKNLILSRPPFDRRNGAGLVLSASLATGQTANTAIPAEHVQGGGSSSGNYAFIYFPRSDLSAAINLRPFSGNRVNAWWYNPRDGKVYNSAGTQDSRPFASYPVSALTQAFTPPPSNDNPNISDWVLVLDDASQGFGTPGLIDSVPDTTPDPGTDPATDPETDPATDPATDPGTDLETDPGSEPVTDPGPDPATDPVTDPGTGLGTDPGNGPDTDPAADPEPDPATDPGTDPGTEPAPDGGNNDSGAIASSTVIVDNTDETIVYTGQWTQEILSGAGQNGTMAVTFDRQATASLTFNGTGIRFYSHKGPGTSRFDIYVDDVYQASWDGYAPQEEFVALAYENTDLSQGTHTITVLNTSNKNELSSATYMNVDWFEVERQLVIDSTDEAIVYTGNWTHEIMSGAGQDGTMAVTFDRQATASLTFNGTGIRLYSRKGPGASIYEIYLDGIYQTSWDGYTPNPENQVLAYQISDLPPGQHTITLRNTRSKNLLSAASYMHVDWFETE